VILGDVPPDKLTKKQRDMLADYVNKDRGGLVVLAGRQFMPASYTGNEFKEFNQLLPVDFVKHTFPIDSPGSPLAYQVKRTAAGQRAKWLMLDKDKEKNDKLWQELPGFFWHYPIADLRGEVLLEHPTAKMEGGLLDAAGSSKDRQPMPLLVWHRYGKGQVMFVGFEESWRWRLNTEDKVFGRFWSQLIVRMAEQHKGIGQVKLEHSVMELGKPGTVYATLLKADFDALRDATVAGELEYLDDKSPSKRKEPLVLEQVPGKGKEGQYRVMVPNDQPGMWQVTLNYPAKTTLTFNVKVPDQHELKEAPMAAVELATAANETKAWGGRFYREQDLKDLVAAITPQETTIRSRQEVLLWGWIPLVLFVGLVTLEWVVRKFSNLS
jgi:hypothetical protein